MLLCRLPPRIFHTETPRRAALVKPRRHSKKTVESIRIREAFDPVVDQG
jgi:hypothetical protein